MPRPLLTVLLALAVVPSLCLGGGSEEKKPSSAEKKALEQAGKLEVLLGSLGVSEKSAAQAAERYEAFRLESEADQRKGIDRLVDHADFASGTGSHRDAQAHFAARGIVPGAGGWATRNGIMDAKREFAESRKENPALYAQYLTDPKTQDILLKRHGVQPPDLDAARPVVFGDGRDLEARKAELKLQPLMRKGGLPPDHAVWVLKEVKGLPELLERGPDAKATEGKDDEMKGKEKEGEEGGGDRPRRRRW